jgi:hypothetical protein
LHRRHDQAKAGHDRALATLSQAKVALQQAQRSLADTAIYSPIDGVVTSKQKSVGETATMMPPTIVLVVQDIEKLELRALLPERALANIKQGSVIRITAPSVKVTRDVKVKRVNPTIDQRTRTVEVVADVDNTASSSRSACSSRSQTQKEARRSASTRTGGSPVETPGDKPNETRGRLDPPAVFAVMMIAALLVFGLLAYPRIGVDLFPNVEFPVVTVTAMHLGHPETIKQGRGPHQAAINTLSGIKALRSTNLESVTQVVVEFELDVA